MPEPIVEEPSSSPEVSTNPSLAVTPNDIARFNSKVVRSPSCWFWTGAISTPDGYGRFTWQRDNEQRTMLAHRFALLSAGVNLPPGSVAEHACNEPLCVRVDDAHVHVSTQRDNLIYAVRSGRHLGPHAAVSSTNRARRSLRIRAALIDGWDSAAFYVAITEPAPEQPPLF
ncbi:hypothetical protein NQ042_10505 [Corynebacterium phoceense]|uniref:hypothetical protein n=1 Tax=Corynebacterium phoceense TaxID=1686286 RepID=UPI00211C73E5|nr:hypothetical protein [Corynebacterium phoceense]MCQ9334495.1 hypothetical protein [Corynebacterium phoceense]